MAQLTVVSPLSGQVWPLERVPDAVFAQKLVGDGLSIDPTDAVLLAGCDGEVIALHAAGHAVTLRTPEGPEVLMHVGIDTVTLKGEGFHPRVKVGDVVRTGDALIAFDLDFLATHARSLLTQVVITDCEQVTSWQRASGYVSAGKDALFTVTFAAPAAAADAATHATITSEGVLIPNPTGLHARPAAVLASVAKTFQSATRLQLGDRHANARSVTAIMALEVTQGAKVQVLATGPDAKAAIVRLVELLAQGCGDEYQQHEVAGRPADGVPEHVGAERQHQAGDAEEGGGGEVLAADGRGVESGSYGARGHEEVGRRPAEAQPPDADADRQHRDHEHRDGTERVAHRSVTDARRHR